MIVDRILAGLDGLSMVKAARIAGVKAPVISRLRSRLDGSGAGSFANKLPALKATRKRHDQR
jgi:hypothetical protein